MGTTEMADRHTGARPAMPLDSQMHQPPILSFCPFGALLYLNPVLPYHLQTLRHVAQFSAVALRPPLRCLNGFCGVSATSVSKPGVRRFLQQTGKCVCIYSLLFSR